MSSENNSKRTRYCVAPGCKNYECGIKTMNDETSQQTITYHNFPTKLSLRKKWFKFVGYDKKPVSSLTWRTWTLCSEHFEDSEFEESCHLECIDGVYRRLNIKLKNGAVPTKSKLLLSSIQSTDGENQTELTNSIDFITTTINSTEIIDNRINSNFKNEYNEIDFDNETIYTELDEDFHSKCGEVFVTRKGTFLYFCTFCNENLENADKFSKHVYKEHLSLYDDTEINNINTNNIKSEDIIAPNNTIIPLQHCEIVENETGNFETISFFDDIQNNENEINQNLYAEIQAKKITTEESKKSKVELQNKSLVNPPIQNIECNYFIDLTEDDNNDDTEDINNSNENINNGIENINNSTENKNSETVNHRVEDIENNTEDIDITSDDDKISIKNEAIIDNRILEISSSKINTDQTIFSDVHNDNSININNSLKDNSELPNSTNNHEILPAAYNDKEFVEADDDDIASEHDEDDDWNPINRKCFKCRYCPKILKSQYSLTVHTRSHTGERPYKCNVCSQSFKSQGILYNHEKTHTGVKPFECKICGLTFTTQYGLNIHEKRHQTQQNQYKCGYCDKKFLRLKKKVVHQRTHNIDIKPELDEEFNLLNKNFKCEFCLKILSSQYSLIEHRRIHTGEKPFPCKFCPSSFRSKLLKICHERSNHTGERPFSCIYCDKAFATKSTRDNHERTHTKERPFKCNLCDKTYRQASAKYMHMKTHFRPKTENRNGRKRNNSASGSVQTNGDNKKHQCEYCKKLLSSQNVLNEHRRIHTGEKPYPCNYCEKKFRAKSILFYHVKTHDGQKPYECKYCQKKFGLAGNMIAHQRTHTGEKPYRCSYCDKCFSQKQSQMVHEKTHIPGYKRAEKEKNSRIWKCDMCGKILLNKYTLNNHIRTHTGERPFKCSYCPSAFKSLSQHSQHERIHSGLKPYKCTECDKAFTTKSQMNAHIRTHATKKLKQTVHKCDHCEREFKFNSNLVLHLRTHKDKSEI